MNLDLPELPKLPTIAFPDLSQMLTPSRDGGMKFDDGKLAYDLVDDDAEAEMVAVLTYGAVKYEPGNWLHVEKARSRYFAALRRHLREARAGKRLDGETTLLALAHAACDIHFLLALELRERPELVASQPRRLAHALDVARKLRAERLAKERAAADELARAVSRGIERGVGEASERSDARPVVGVQWTVLSAPREREWSSLDAALGAAGRRILARGDAPNHSSARAASRRALRAANRVRGYLQITEVLAGGSTRAHAPEKLALGKNRRGPGDNT